jgi:hypothetical protein
VIAIYGTWPFYENARKALRSRVLEVSWPLPHRTIPGDWKWKPWNN